MTFLSWWVTVKPFLIFSPYLFKQIKTNKWGVVFLHPNIIIFLEHTWSFVRLACRRHIKKYCGVKLMSKKKNPVVPIMKSIQARSNLPEVPTFSAAQFVWMLTTGWHCSLGVVFKCKLVVVKRDTKSNQYPITCQKPYCVSSCCCFSSKVIWGNLWLIWECENYIYYSHDVIRAVVASVIFYAGLLGQKHNGGEQ